jgi:hypothetical protein
VRGDRGYGDRPPSMDLVGIGGLLLGVAHGVDDFGATGVGTSKSCALFAEVSEVEAEAAGGLKVADGGFVVEGGLAVVEFEHDD